MTDEASPNADGGGTQAPVEMSPSQAADVVGAAVANIRQRWLQISVTVASAIRNGQAVSNGTFEDMRQLREKYEELERARLVLQKMGSGDQSSAE